MEELPSQDSASSAAVSEEMQFERRMSAGSFASFSGNNNNNNNNPNGLSSLEGAEGGAGLDDSINSSFDGGAGGHMADLMNDQQHVTAAASANDFQDDINNNNNGGGPDYQQQEREIQQMAEQQQQQITEQQQQQQQQVMAERQFQQMNTSIDPAGTTSNYQTLQSLATQQQQPPTASVSTINGDSAGLGRNGATSEMERIESNLQTVEQTRNDQRRSSQQPSQQQHQHQQNEVIDLLDSDDDDEDNNKALPVASVQTNGVNKRAYSQMRTPPTSTVSVPRRNPYPIQPGSTIAGYSGTIGQQYQPHHQYHQQHQHPQMMRMQQLQPRPQQQYMNHHHQGVYHHQAPPTGQAAAIAQMHQQQQKRPRPRVIGEPKYVPFPEGHRPSWRQPLPNLNVPRHDPNEPRNYEMSLLNVNEFTITGMARGTFDTRRTSVLGYRKAIRDISKPHGKAVFERDKDNENTESGADGGKWRIPLGAYRALVTFFKSLPNCYVQEIPEDQLKIASLGKARLEKGYPSAEKIVSLGVPRGLASALAPFQRGGVEFVNEKEGRALIAGKR